MDHPRHARKTRQRTIASHALDSFRSADQSLHFVRHHMSLLQESRGSASQRKGGLSLYSQTRIYTQGEASALLLLPNMVKTSQNMAIHRLLLPQHTVFVLQSSRSICQHHDYSPLSRPGDTQGARQRIIRTVATRYLPRSNGPFTSSSTGIYSR